MHKEAPFRLKRPEKLEHSILIASPHSGALYPQRFLDKTVLPIKALRRSEDAFVDQLLDWAPESGFALLTATYARAYLDLNREAYELDPLLFEDPLPAGANTTSERVLAGYGTIARVVGPGKHIYADKLNFETEVARIDDIYTPYHQALNGLLEETHRTFGSATLIDVHSMPSQTGTARFGFGIKRPQRSVLEDEPDFVLGDRFGRSCSSELTTTVERFLADRGYKVARNAPYAGGYCTEAHGRPFDGYHTLQIEINRKLYMNETEISAIGPSLRQLRGDLYALLIHLKSVGLGLQEAAE